MKSNAFFSYICLLVALIPVTAKAQPWSVGKAVCLSENPTNREWNRIVNILLFSDDREAVNSADANICLKAGEDVMLALKELYLVSNPEIQDVKPRLARVFAGVHKEGALNVAREIVADNSLPTDHPLVVASARALTTRGGEGGIDVVSDRLKLLGDLPAEGMQSWQGSGLLDALGQCNNPELQQKLIAFLSSESSAVRLGAVSALVQLNSPEARSALLEVSEKDKNQLVRDAAKKVLADSPSQP